MTKEEYWPMEKSLDCDGISVILTESDESDHVKVTYVCMYVCIYLSTVLSNYSLDHCIFPHD